MGAGLLRVDNLPLVLVVTLCVMAPLVDDFVTRLEEEAEVDLSEVEGSPWPIRLGSIWVVDDDEFSYGRQARAVVTAG